LSREQFFGRGSNLQRGSNPPTRSVLRQSGSPERASLSSGEAEGSILVKTSRELVVLRGTGYFGVWQGPGVPTVSTSSEVETAKVHEGRDREADLTAPEERSGEAEKPMRVSARVDFGLHAGTDLRREQSLGAAGHRDLLVLRARERDVMNSMRAQAPKAYGSAGGKRSGG
jgi:hypothetical protein